jgi:hydrogenase nickel incorporation protein HypB
MAKVTIIENVNKANDQIAAQNQTLLDQTSTLAVNLMASPGAGKTSLLIRTIEALRDRLAIGAIEGDTASQVDADKVGAAWTPIWSNRH